MAISARPRVLIAGGGVAALEAALALRSFLDERELEVALMTNQTRFVYRPLAVLEPFGIERTWTMPLAKLAADHDVAVVGELLREVDAAGREVLDWTGRRHSYDLLLVAVGARLQQALPRARLFRGPQDASALRATIAEIAERRADSLTFVIPPGTFWTLPAYELALMSADAIGRRRSDAQVRLVTPELAPLEAFGHHAGEAVAAMLARHEIELVTDAQALRVATGRLELAGGRSLITDRVVALPALVGPRLPGLPHDAAGFLPVDEHGRVRGCPGVYAAGDVTDHPLKHGGLACQQADAAADAILAELGFPIAPRPFRPVLEGVLLSPDEPAYLLRGAGSADDHAPRPWSLWWPPSKIAGRHLGPYLTTRAGAPRTPEQRPPGDIVPVTLDLAAATRRSGAARGST